MTNSVFADWQGIRNVFVPMHTIVTEGKKGTAWVKHFAAESVGSVQRLRSMMNGQLAPSKGEKYVALYTMNKHYTEILEMSDTPEERKTNMLFVKKAKGRVLIGGLGVGMVLEAILRKPEVTHVTVVEANFDVMELVGPHVGKGHKRKLTIVPGDIFTWNPPEGAKYDTVYFDIWPHISSDNLEEMERLHKKFMPFRKSRGWMDSWQRGRCNQLASQEIKLLSPQSR